jgi:hypothetical protein
MVTHEPDVAGYTRRTLVLRDGSVVSDRPVQQGSSAADDLEHWKRTHHLLAAGAGQEAAS